MAQLRPVAEWLRRADNGDWLFANGHYLLRFTRERGYAVTDVRITAATGRRLDQFWTPDLTFDPMCRCFDNLAFTGPDVAEIQGYVTMHNTFVKAEMRTLCGRPGLVQEGYLQRREDRAKGGVRFAKRLVFQADHYEVTLTVTTPEGSAFRYADIWWDVNDDWSDRYENSLGDWILLRDRTTDAPAPNGPETFRSMRELDRGYGVWMAVSGPDEKILVSTDDPAFKALPHAGLSFYDGMDEPDQAPEKYKSHSCMALCLSSGATAARPFEPTAVTVRYRVHFLARTSYEALYEVPG